MTAVAIAVVFRPIRTAWQTGGGLFFTPYHLLGDCFPLVTLLFLTASPFMLMIAVYRLANDLPGPVLGWTFLSVWLGVVASSAMRTLDFYATSIAVMPFVLLLALSVTIEVTVRKLKRHRLVAFCCIELAIAYWFTVSSLITAMG